MPRRLLPLLAFLVAVLAPSASAQETRPVEDGSTLQYTGRAPLHSWTGRSDEVSGTLALDLDDPARSSVTLSVPVASFDSGNGTRDRRMREATEAERFPEVTFASRSVTPTTWRGAPGARSGRWIVRGDLSFHGVTRTVEATVDVREERGRFVAEPAFEIQMTEFDVPRPRLGPARTSDTLCFQGRITARL